MSDPFDTKGCTALITGASRGLGAALVQGFLDAGAARIYAGGRERPEASRWHGVDRVVPLQLAIDNPEQVRAAAQRAADIDLLINNAGIDLRAPLLGEPTLETARREMEVNFFGPLNMCRSFADALRRRRGALVNVLSLAALANMPAVGSYSASKAAARSMTQGLRAELAPSGVRVFAVYPGAYDTDMAVGFKGEKNPPSLFVAAVIAALRSGAPQDIFPDETGKGMEHLMLTDPRELERLCGAIMPSSEFGRDGRGNLHGH
jgi:NAD(P)-dependent dehydrogenase (short-subunit alcohol dehydrogenase family)